MQLVPHVSATTAGTQSREPKRGVVLVSKSLELVELADVLPGADHRDLRVLEACCLQVAQRAKRPVVGAGATHIVIDVSRRAIARDLHVHIVGLAEEPGPPRGVPDSVGGGPNPTLRGAGTT